MLSENGVTAAPSLRPIDADNFWDIIGLEVADGQQDYVLSNAVSIAQARVQPECVPLAIYNGNTPVGFVMYCLDRDDGEYWIYRLMIDQEHQRKGLAKTAMRHVLREIALDRARDKVYLGVRQDNDNAVELYHKLGFRFDGRIFGHEHVMVLDSLEPFRGRWDGA
ncbi:MAG: GNAT family N-acetyltransferase [Clostridiaceae bacterium]|jgi:diamine N-acetyltransferase|nr:GNAT family N-acetyltransferase [Clostridiaceae bacterium]